MILLCTMTGTIYISSKCFVKKMSYAFCLLLVSRTAPTPSVFFDPASYTVNENAGTATLTIRTDVPGGPVDGAVEFYTEDGSAIGQYSAHQQMLHSSLLQASLSKFEKICVSVSLLPYMTLGHCTCQILSHSVIDA